MQTIKYYKKILSNVALLLLLYFPVFSQNDVADSLYAFTDTLPRSVHLFDNDEVFDISLRFDITQYKKKRSDEDYLDAILTYYTGENDSVNKDIRVRARGEFRRNFCHLPPLMLNFRSESNVSKEFSRINKLKMVTMCKKSYEEYLLKEYLAYRLYGIMTDYSFRVRLLRIKYINTAKNNDSVTEFAFAIEPKELLAERIGSVEVKADNLSRNMIKPEILDRMSIFNYMIGNADWTLTGQHNVVVLSDPKSDRPDLGIVVPYDFDYTGLVNAEYAIPGEKLGIESVRERVYLGLCRDREVFEKALAEFIEKKSILYREIEEFPFLNEKSKHEMIRYLESFYLQFDKRNTIINNLLYFCRKYSNN